MRRMAAHNINYRVLKDHMGGEPVHRDVAVCATAEELETLGRAGFLIREAAVGGDWLQSLRAALDRLTHKEWPDHRPPLDGDGATSFAAAEMPARSWGVILRHLLDKDAAFHDLLAWPPALSVARAMMGPLVRLRGLSARVSFAGAEPQDTPWHQHLRVIPNPLPPWFSQPHAIDCLIYLDDLNDDTGAPLGGAGLAPLARPRATAAALRTHPGRANASPAGWQHGDRPRQPVAPGPRHAPGPATHAHPVVHTVLAARIPARRPGARRRSYPGPTCRWRWGNTRVAWAGRALVTTRRPAAAKTITMAKRAPDGAIGLSAIGTQGRLALTSNW